MRRANVPYYFVNHEANTGALSKGINCTLNTHWLNKLYWTKPIFAVKSAGILHLQRFATATCTDCASRVHEPCLDVTKEI